MSVRLMMASLSIILAATVELGCSQVYKYHSCCGWGNLVNKLIPPKVKEHGLISFGCYTGKTNSSLLRRLDWGQLLPFKPGVTMDGKPPCGLSPLKILIYKFFTHGPGLREGFYQGRMFREGGGRWEAFLPPWGSLRLRSWRAYTALEPRSHWRQPGTYCTALPASIPHQRWNNFKNGNISPHCKHHVVAF